MSIFKKRSTESYQEAKDARDLIERGCTAGELPKLTDFELLTLATANLTEALLHDPELSEELRRRATNSFR